jgi:cytochrome c peroxidase
VSNQSHDQGFNSAVSEVTILCRATLLISFLAFTVACDRLSKSPASERPIGNVIEVKTPLGLPPLPVPSDNPETAETIALGRNLFYETKLSRHNSLSCSSCHNPLIGFTDGQKFSRGASGKFGTRNAPTVINAAYVPIQFWDGRAASLEEQAGSPMASPIEMDQAHDVAVSKLEADPSYRARFEKAFGPGPVTIGKVSKALASFERTLLSGDSAFDKYEYGGRKDALSAAAIRGLAIFRDSTKGNCATCHTINDKFALFTDGKFHNIGVGVNEEGDLTDLGRYNQTKMQADKGSFKTPTLRNVALSAPYMHDGSLKTLKDVVDFYAGGGNSNPFLDKEIKVIKLSGQERADLVEFLKALTGEMPPNAGPPENTQIGKLK